MSDSTIPNRSVSLTLGSVVVTSSFQSALMAAAHREGLSVPELLLSTVAERLEANGLKFNGVFRAGDREQAAEDPFDGDDSRVTLNLGSMFISKAAAAAFDRYRPKGMFNRDWAVRLMKEDVLRRARAGK